MLSYTDTCVLSDVQLEVTVDSDDTPRAAP